MLDVDVTSVDVSGKPLRSEEHSCDLRFVLLHKTSTGAFSECFWRVPPAIGGISRG